MWSGAPEVPAADRWYLDLPERFQEEAFEGVDAVIHCAVESSRNLEIARAVNVDGTLALARAASRAGERAFLFLSSQSARPDAAAAYGPGLSLPDEALERSTPHAAVIATPAASHLPLARRCFEEGLAMLIEKPLAPTAAP